MRLAMRRAVTVLVVVSAGLAIVVGMFGRVSELGEAVFRSLDVRPPATVERLGYLAAIWVSDVALLLIAAIAYGRYQRQA
jgi:hypothetical protein